MYNAMTTTDISIAMHYIDYALWIAVLRGAHPGFMMELHKSHMSTLKQEDPPSEGRPDQIETPRMEIPAPAAQLRNDNIVMAMGCRARKESRGIRARACLTTNQLIIQVSCTGP